MPEGPIVSGYCRYRRQVMRLRRIDAIVSNAIPNTL